VRGWNRRAEAWLLSLRTWQFLLLFDVVTALVVMIGVPLVGLVWGFNLSAILGGVCGSVLAASVMALASRDRMRIRAEQGPGAPVQRRAPGREATGP
jgi:hypothetical protein